MNKSIQTDVALPFQLDADASHTRPCALCAVMALTEKSLSVQQWLDRQQQAESGVRGYNGGMTSPTFPEIKHLGKADYDSTFAAMRAFTDARTPDTRDELWIVEHAPVYTLGLGADRGHLLGGASEIPVVQTDRGGEVTYHGPGQVVIYLLMDLRRNKPGGKLYARQFVHKIEQAIINVLQAYNLVGERVDGAPGIYMAGGDHQGAKIAALGLKVRGNGCTYHGLSLNVAMDLAPFSWINPCGYAGLETVDMRTVGAQAMLSDVQQQLAEELVRVLAANE